MLPVTGCYQYAWIDPRTGVTISSNWGVFYFGQVYKIVNPPYYMDDVVFHLAPFPGVCGYGS